MQVKSQPDRLLRGHLSQSLVRPGPWQLQRVTGWEVLTDQPRSAPLWESAGQKAVLVEGPADQLPALEGSTSPWTWTASLHDNCDSRELAAVAGLSAGERKAEGGAGAEPR